MPPRDHSRRSVLKAAGYAGATVVVAGTGALSYRVWDSAVLDPDHGRAFDPWRHSRDDSGPLGLVAAGILGANPHNTQPWRFVISDKRIDAFADRSRHTALLDPRSRELRVGLGCAIENIAIAASVRGLAPTVTLLPVSVDPDHVARIELATGPAGPSTLFDAIGERHTNRGPFRRNPLTPSVLASMVDVSGLSGVAVTWMTDDTHKAALGRLWCSVCLRS